MAATREEDSAKHDPGDDRQPRVPQQTTALIASAIGGPHYAQASDGQVHIEYDLILTNWISYPVILTSVQVFGDRGRQLLALEGDTLEAVTRRLPNADGPTSVVAASGAVAVVIDLAVPPREIPRKLTHRIVYELDPDMPEISKALIGSLSIEGLELVVRDRGPIVIAPPLSGDGWLSPNACCEMTPHRVFRIIANGERYTKPETFAVDWIRLQGNRFFSGDGTRNDQYFAYGAELKAVANGEVVFVRDALPDETPNRPPAQIKQPLDFAGNQVVVRIGPGVFATYAHVLPGSVEVRAGDRVRTGQRLGLLGSSGNSTSPHLHFGLSDGPDILTSNSLPFVIDHYRLVGVMTPDSTPTDIRIMPTPRNERETYPLVNSLINLR